MWSREELERNCFQWLWHTHNLGVPWWSSGYDLGLSLLWPKFNPWLRNWDLTSLWAPPKTKAEHLIIPSSGSSTSATLTFWAGYSSLLWGCPMYHRVSAPKARMSLPDWQWYFTLPVRCHGPPALRCVSPPAECSGIQEEGAGHARRSHTWKHQGRSGCSGGGEEMWARAISVKGPAGARRGERAWDWLAPGGAVSPGSARQRCQMSETPGVSASEDNQKLVQTLFPMCHSLCQLAL